MFSVLIIKVWNNNDEKLRAYPHSAKAWVTLFVIMFYKNRSLKKNQTTIYIVRPKFM